MKTHSELLTGSNWKLSVAYDGTDFHGWQVQPQGATIQGAIADAILRVTGEQVLPQGSGRTDAGVHARGQVASFALNAPIPESNLLRALNRTLPESIRALAAEHVPPDFHARHSAHAKTYEYVICRAEICPPWKARFSWALHWPLDLARLQAAAATVIGAHDFTSFAASDPDLTTRCAEEPSPDSQSPELRVQGNIRTLYESLWSEQDDLLLYRVRGNGFLHHMVRNLVGTFIDAGRGQIAPDDVAHILAARSRSAAGATAPARGLFLDRVEY